MGNSTSNASNSPNQVIRETSPAPTPGNPHSSLRTKKKSLELPDLASLSLDNTRGRQAKTASIPIPTTPPSPFRHYQQAQQPQRAPRHLPSTADVNIVVPTQPNLPPFPPAPRPNPAAPRDRQQPVPPRQQQQQQQVARMQELYNQSQQPAHSPSHQLPFQQEIVRSSIPVALTKALPNELPPAEEIVQREYPQKEDLLADFVPVKVVWKGGGTQVVLARAGDEEWKGRQAMEKESANVWTLTVMLRPGTHHVRFLVDGQWRVADDLPAAVDDQGSLANYVAVPIPVPSTPAPAPPPPVTREKLVPGQSFWSADSSADGEYQQQSQQRQQQQTHPHATHSHSVHWTNILPPELIEAAREEEAYLSASAGQYEVPSSNTRVTTGFVPAPNIPPAPGLPRHLEKLILNTRVSAGAVGTGIASGAARTGSGQAVGGVGSMGVGSGQGQAARKERRDRERDGDRERRDGDKRDRDRERGERAMRKRATAAAASAVFNIPPPPPPPSEDGLVPPSTHVPETSLIGSTAVESTDLNTSSTMTPSSTSAPAISTNTNTSTTPPQTSLPSTPVVPLSPVWPKEPGKALGDSGENGTGPEPSPTTSPTRSPTTLHNSIPNVSATTSANASATTSAAPSPNPNTYSTTPTVTPPSSAIPSSHPSPTPSHPIPTGSRTITIDTTNMPSLSDDGSVLPVPSHVVLHHLSTSAIRNGVLAVGNTIRYRKKYLTTIYYKPT